MNTIIDNEITIYEPTEDIIQWCEDNLVVDNPDYANKERLGLWVGHTPKKLSLFKQRGTDLILPYGSLREIYPLIKDSAVKVLIRPIKHIGLNCNVKLYDYQQQAVDEMVKAKFGILQSAAGSGKGLLLDAKIYTPQGFKYNKDLKIGDIVLDKNGGTCKVTAIYDRCKQPCYRVTFSDNVEVICDADHLWQVIPDKRRKQKVINTVGLINKGITSPSGRFKYEIPIVEPVMFDNAETPIDSWLLGLLLGDGYFANEISFSNSEPDIIQRVCDYYSDGTIKHKGKYDWRIVDGAVTKNKLCELGLMGKRSHNKFIPDIYKYNSIENRLNVLRGLMDSDGSVKGSSYSISSTSKKLMEDTLEIIQSLGGTGKIAQRQTYYTYNDEKLKGKLSYRLYFKLYKFLPFSSKKHTENYSPRTKYVEPYRKIVNIEYVGLRHTQCISVDAKDKLFVTDGFVVTHNTQMGIGIIGKLDCKTLWLTHTSDLPKQSYDRAAQYIDKSKLGVITDGKVNIGSGITFATVQTLSKQDLTLYKNEWDCVIIDEVHRVAGGPSKLTQFSKVINNLSCKHKYGLSATVHRSDGLINSTFALIGNVAYKVPDNAIADKVMQVRIKPRRLDTRLNQECLDTDGTLIYAKLISTLADDMTRNEHIVKDLVSNSNHYNLILSDRLNHLRKLMEMLPSNVRSMCVMVDGSMTSKAGKAKREQALEQMRAGEKHYLFASYKLAKEGLDIPRLDRLYMTTPQKDYAVITQSIGRIARTFEGKGEPVCYDYIDADIGFLNKMYGKRCTSYRKARCKING